MSIEEQIEKYIASHSEPKRSDMQALHELTLQAAIRYGSEVRSGRGPISLLPLPPKKPVDP